MKPATVDATKIAIHVRTRLKPIHFFCLQPKLDQAADGWESLQRLECRDRQANSAIAPMRLIRLTLGEAVVSA
jgi:hypothetical protein